MPQFKFETPCRNLFVKYCRPEWKTEYAIFHVVSKHIVSKINGTNKWPNFTDIATKNSHYCGVRKIQKHMIQQYWIRDDLKPYIRNLYNIQLRNWTIKITIRSPYFYYSLYSQAKNENLHTNSCYIYHMYMYTQMFHKVQKVQQCEMLQNNAPYGDVAQKAPDKNNISHYHTRKQTSFITLTPPMHSQFAPHTPNSNQCRSANSAYN